MLRNIFSRQSLHTLTKNVAMIQPKNNIARRFFTTNKVVRNTATATAVSTNDDQGAFSEIVNKWGGWYPIAGMTGAIIVSKEIFIMNEEFLMISNFGVMIFTFYMVGGDILTQATAEMKQAQEDNQRGAVDFQIATYKALITARQNSAKQIAVLEDLKQHYNTLVKDVVVAKNNKIRQRAVDAILKRFSDIRAHEASQAGEQKTKQANAITAAVIAAFSKEETADIRRILIEQAIDLFDDKEVKTHPVQELFNKFSQAK